MNVPLSAFRQRPLRPGRNLRRKAGIKPIDFGGLKLLQERRADRGLDMLSEQLGIPLPRPLGNFLLLAARGADAQPLVEPLLNGQFDRVDVVAIVAGF